jgi:hypothetical protein
VFAYVGSIQNLKDLKGRASMCSLFSPSRACGLTNSRFGPPPAIKNPQAQNQVWVLDLLMIEAQIRLQSFKMQVG